MKSNSNTNNNRSLSVAIWDRSSKPVQGSLGNWTDECEAQQVLNRMFENKEKNGNSGVEEIWNSYKDKIFQNYTLAVFKNTLEQLYGYINVCSIKA